MKKTNLFFGSLIFCSLTFSSFAANVCAPGVCTFSSLKKSGDTATFYCTTAADVTEVHFQNHNVNIGGFDDNGELTLKDGDVSKLKTYYFKVSIDPDRSESAAKTVTFNVDGKTKCSMGKGGRKLAFNGIFKAL